MNTFLSIILLVNEILVGPSLSDKVKEFELTKRELTLDQTLILQQECNPHPLLNSKTSITYKLEDNGTMFIIIGKDKSAPCSVIKLSDIQGYYIKNNRGEIILIKKW